MKTSKVEPAENHEITGQISGRIATAAPLLPSWRFLSAVLELLGTLVLYMNRVNISFALVCMTKAPGNQITPDGNDSVFNFTQGSVEDKSSFNITSSLSLSREAEFAWDRKLVGFIISSFFIGYILTQLPSGWAATRISAKWLLVSGMVVTILTSFLSPVAARGGWGYLVALQIIKGLACGTFYPTLQNLISSWAAPHERSRLYTIAYSGSSVGNIVAFASGGFLCSDGFAGGWPSVFYVYAICGTVWLIIFAIFVHDNPGVHPFVSKNEKEYIQHSLVEDFGFRTEKMPGSVPWKSIFTSLPLLAIVTAQTGYCWLWYTALSSLPLYINDVLKFNIKGNGLASSMPYVVNLMVGLISSYIADQVIHKKPLQTTTVRNIAVSCAMLLPAIFIISAGFLKSHQYKVAVSLISLAVGCLSFARPGNHVNSLEIAPRYASITRGIDNTICNVAGFLSPLITGQLAPNGTHEEWRRVFFLAGGISLFAEVVYLIFGTADVQPWAKEKSDAIDEHCIPDWHLYPLSQSKGDKTSDTPKLLSQCALS